MSTDVASTDYGVIIHYDEWNTLELKWLPATKDATEAQARDTMALFAALAEKRTPRFLIVDTTEMMHRFANDMMAWRVKEIIPRYNAGASPSSASSPAKLLRTRPSSPVPSRRPKALRRSHRGVRQLRLGPPVAGQLSGPSFPATEVSHDPGRFPAPKGGLLITRVLV